MQKMNAPLQYRLDHADLALVLALVRGGSLARAAELLRVDVSTVFRAIRRLEKNLGKALFDKSRSGYLANQTARRLAQQAELAEQALEAARIGLELELATSNDFANLSRRDADIALRMTRTPPEHLVGRNLGEVRYVLCASERYLEGRDATEPAMLHWIAPDDFLPDHPSVVWRRRHYPGVLPAYRCNGVLAVAEMARAGLGLAAIPAYLLRDGDGLRVLDADLEGCASALWLLTRPDCRALRSVVALFDELGRHVRLGDE
ncbi:LysR family transcriptional regulator [Pseudomonas aeruginosa]|uniref:LysR family transcriptional regulator n=1 Tax=Pseudomonas aeruginosa TaxID=287 RepID=UPI0026EE3E49|nr:LysR family transcriptional regulator [Pseudomonas aeruginosa]